MRHQIGFLRARLPVVLDPVLHIGHTATSSRDLWCLPSHRDSRMQLVFGGTAAIYQAARALRLTSKDKVLVPAYNCGHEIEPFLRAGAQVGVYRVDERLDIDLGHLESMLDSTVRAVLVTHYFGFPQPVRAIRELCNRRGVALIEDCAHALFSAANGEPLGLTGHMAVFSLRKTLPLPHGGALVIHDPRWSLPQDIHRPPMWSTAPKLLERYQKSWLLPKHAGPQLMHRGAFVATRLLVDMARSVRTLAQTLGAVQLDPDDESLDFPSEALNWGVSASVERNLFRCDASAIVARRRRNYELLLAESRRFPRCQPVLPQLPEGVCPLYFPLISAEAENQVEHLQRGAVAAISWWSTYHPSVPWDQFPEAERLKHQIFALPIHQDLGDEHMSRIVAVLARS